MKWFSKVGLSNATDAIKSAWRTASDFGEYTNDTVCSLSYMSRFLHFRSSALAAEAR